MGDSLNCSNNHFKMIRIKFAIAVLGITVFTLQTLATLATLV